MIALILFACFSSPAVSNPITTIDTAAPPAEPFEDPAVAPGR